MNDNRRLNLQGKYLVFQILLVELNIFLFLQEQ